MHPVGPAGWAAKPGDHPAVADGGGGADDQALAEDERLEQKGSFQIDWTVQDFTSRIEEHETERIWNTGDPWT